MEALAAGVPVVTRDLPVFREVFGSTNGTCGPNGANSTDGANGTGANGSGAKAAAVRFAAEGIRPDQPTADSLAGQLLAALEEPPGAGIGAEPGRQLAGRHSWDDAAHAHLRLYTELIARGVPIGS
jgi:glycosyltransferase involved in cell wall biosynthesis